jgi:thiol-disulfide isomerase/thioredoxin
VKTKLLILAFLAATSSFAQTAEVIKKDQFMKLFAQDSGMVVLNFWASWCKPCLREMPYFRKADSTYALRGVTFVFVSFDMVEDLNRVNRIIAANGIPGKYFLLDESDVGSLIDSVDTGWSGGLPATWFLSPLYRKSWFSNFEHSDDLFKEIDLLIAGSDENQK